MKKLGEYVFLLGLLVTLGIEHMFRPIIRHDTDRLFVAAILAIIVGLVVIGGILFVMGAMIFGR